MNNEEDDWFELSLINIIVDGRKAHVYVQDYADAKLKELQEFGYKSLTLDQLIRSIRRVVNKEKYKDVIDHFVEHDIDFEPNNDK